MVVQNGKSMLLPNIQISDTYKYQVGQNAKANSPESHKEPVEKPVDLSIKNKARGTIRDHYKESDNVQSAISRIQVADGSLKSINDMLIKMTELCVQASKHDATPEDRRTITAEIQQLKIKMSQSADAEFENEPVLDDISVESLGLTDMDASTPENAQQLSEQLSKAMDTVSKRQESLAAEKENLVSSSSENINRTYTIDASAFKDDVITNAKESMLSQIGNDRNLVMSLLQ